VAQNYRYTSIVRFREKRSVRPLSLVFPDIIYFLCEIHYLFIISIYNTVDVFRTDKYIERCNSQLSSVAS